MNPRQVIISGFPQLTPELQRAAAFVLEHPNDLVVLSLRAFAAQAGVKPATLSRLAQRLNYPGWGELKNAFVAELGLSNDTYVSKAEKLISQGDQGQLYQDVFAAQAANLEHTRQVNEQSMGEVVELLDKAEHIYVCGFRASFPLAWSLFYIYRLFNKKVTLIDGLASNLEVFTRELTPQDALLLIGFSPYSRESLTVLEAARQRHCPIAAVTDSPLSPLAQAADCALYFTTDSPSFFPSIMAGMGVAECLLAMLVNRYGKDAVAKIESVEHYLIDSGAYVLPSHDKLKK